MFGRSRIFVWRGRREERKGERAAFPLCFSPPVGTRSQGERAAWRCSQRASLRSLPSLHRSDDAEPAAIATATTTICDRGCGRGKKKNPPMTTQARQPMGAPVRLLLNPFSFSLASLGAPELLGAGEKKNPHQRRFKSPQLLNSSHNEIEK